MILYVIQTIGGNKNHPDNIDVMANYHYYYEIRAIIPSFPSMLETSLKIFVIFAQIVLE